ncbi:ABC transporter ATP-binding protein [Chondromyces crocatus]|uniref:ABC transporter ATP-binding protein n=1 Tax=Chondromyces crocatus TaxID=52 RepID=UPI00067BC2DC|nr:ABC transporter ATP-binding protein [Chondromyces crocatus]
MIQLSTPSALLEARGARVSVDDVVALEGLTFVARGDRVLCAGDTQALFAAVSGMPLMPRGQATPGDAPGEARVVAGSLLLAGRDVSRAEQLSVMGVAPLDPPLPPAWTAEAYVTWSARLGGAGAFVARGTAAASLTLVGLGHARHRRLDGLALPERRAMMLAAAIVLSPEVVVLEDPLSGLDGMAAAFVLSAIAAATRGRRALISTGRLDRTGPTGALVGGASDLLVLSAGELVFAGTPADASGGRRLFALVVRGQTESLQEALSARGLTLRAGAGRLLVSLPEGASTRAIVEAAAEVRAPIVEMVPVI